MDEEPNMSYAHPLTVKDIIMDEQKRETIEADMHQTRLAQKVRANQQQIGGAHYAIKSIQPWDFIIANNLGYLEGNIVKYVSRWKDKNGVEDLKKAQHYLQKLIEVSGEK